MKLLKSLSYKIYITRYFNTGFLACLIVPLKLFYLSVSYSCKMGLFPSAVYLKLKT